MTALLNWQFHKLNSVLGIEAGNKKFDSCHRYFYLTLRLSAATIKAILIIISHFIS